MFYVKKIFTVALLLIAGSLSAQPKTPSVEARFSADSVLIGDQFRLDIEVDKDVMEVVEFPVFDIWAAIRPTSKYSPKDPSIR